MGTLEIYSVFPGISEVSVPVHVCANPLPLYKTPSKRNPGLLLAIHFGVPYSGYQLLAGVGLSWQLLLSDIVCQLCLQLHPWWSPYLWQTKWCEQHESLRPICLGKKGNKSHRRLQKRAASNSSPTHPDHTPLYPNNYPYIPVVSCCILLYPYSIPNISTVTLKTIPVAGCLS